MMITFGFECQPVTTGCQSDDEQEENRKAVVGRMDGWMSLFLGNRRAWSVFMVKAFYGFDWFRMLERLSGGNGSQRTSIGIYKTVKLSRRRVKIRI